MTHSRLFALLALLLSTLLVGCAGLPAQVDRPVSKALVAPADSPLGSVARNVLLHTPSSVLIVRGPVRVRHADRAGDGERLPATAGSR